MEGQIMKKMYVRPHMNCVDIDMLELLCLSYTEEVADGDGEELNNDVKEEFGNIEITNLWDEEW